MCAERQSHANLAAIASSLTLHMVDSASAMACPARMQTLTPPSSPRNTPVPSRATLHAAAHQSRYAPYSQQRTNSNHLKSTNPRAPAKYAVKSVPKHFAISPAPSQLPAHLPTAPMFAASLAESQQIQQIVLVALTTLKLPPHAIVLALYFVHKLLIATVRHAQRRAAAASGSCANASPLVAISNASDEFQKQWSPVHLFVAGLMLADAVLCDAPVAVAAWAWILAQASVSADSRTVRDLRRWALDILEFDVNVKPTVYAAWARNINVFLRSRGVFGIDECMLAL
ncbi:hypothetical protein HDU82_000272 [Entophlyctis luteolus]|nr:hypothetical protein HDU82_000272 [Entophlyctis luteolus]